MVVKTAGPDGWTVNSMKNDWRQAFSSQYREFHCIGNAQNS